MFLHPLSPSSSVLPDELLLVALSLLLTLCFCHLPFLYIFPFSKLDQVWVWIFSHLSIKNNDIQYKQFILILLCHTQGLPLKNVLFLSWRWKSVKFHLFLFSHYCLIPVSFHCMYTGAFKHPPPPLLYAEHWTSSSYTRNEETTMFLSICWFLMCHFG